MTLGPYGSLGASFYYQVRLEYLEGCCEDTGLWIL